MSDSRWGAVRFFIRRYPLGAAGAVIMAIFLFAAAFAPYITVYDPLSTNAAASLARPSAAHWLGCDFMGRDVYSRIIYGARISLVVGCGSMLLGVRHRRRRSGCCRATCSAGSTWSTQRVLEMMQSLPLLVMAIIMAAALGPSLHNTILAIAIPLVPYVARVDPRQHAEPARAALCRGGEGDRHVGDCASRSATCCRTRWRR